MKRLATLLTLVFAVTLAYGQSETDKPLKGPEAKNHKPWMDSGKETLVLTSTTEVTEVKGPEAKNEKAWERPKASATVVRFGSARTKLKGPKAKNFKYFE